MSGGSNFVSTTVQPSNDVFTKFTKTNFMKGREPKIHMKVSSPIENDEAKSSQNDRKTQSKPISEIQEFIFPSFEDVDMNSSNIEEFLSKHWIELMEVCYGLINEIFLKICNIQVSEEVFKLFSYIQSWSNKNISQYIYDRLFSRQKLSLDQHWFKHEDRIETLERQKADLKREIMDMQELLMAVSNNSQSISTLQGKSRHHSMDEEDTNMMPTSRNINANLKGNDTAEFGQSNK